jgi:hypothetical protein
MGRSDRGKGKTVSGHRGVRGVISGIDEQLDRVAREQKALVAERERLLAARAALTGRAGAGPARGKRISQDDVAAYLAEHPGSTASRVAEALGVPATNVSTHLYRAKDLRFQRKSDGWYVLSGEGS